MAAEVLFSVTPGTSTPRETVSVRSAAAETPSTPGTRAVTSTVMVERPGVLPRRTDTVLPVPLTSAVSVLLLLHS